MRIIISVIAFILLGTNVYAQDLKVVMLGTGTPLSIPERSGAGVAIISGGKAYIVDSGPGIIRRAMAAFNAGHAELQPGNLDTVFITHLHSDHTTGLANMILAPWVLRRDVPMKLYGPPGSKHMADNLIEAYEQDIEMRINGSQPANPDGYKVITREHAAAGQIYEDMNIIVEAIKVPHGRWEYAFGYKFTEKSSSKTVVVSGDTAKSEAIQAAATGADILVHEVVSGAGIANRPEQWQIYMREFHTTPSELADLAGKAKPRLLVLYHQVYWDKANEDIAAEVKAAGYKGNVVSANDLDVYEIK